MPLGVFLGEKLDYELYSEVFLKDLAKIIQDNLPEDEADSAQILAHKYVQNQQDAVNKVNEILSNARKSLDIILSMAQLHRAKELVHQYFQQDSEAHALVHAILTKAGKSVDSFSVDALTDQLDFVERIDRLQTSAESRRDDSLHQIDRRRASFGERLRQAVQRLEEDELKVIETTPAKGKEAA
jgi:DNA-directed RNA polymerase subunit F